MDTEKDLLDFQALYHSYTDSLAELAERQEECDTILNMDEDDYYFQQEDEGVVIGRTIHQRVRESLAELQNQMSADERKAENDLVQEVSRTQELKQDIEDGKKDIARLQHEASTYSSGAKLLKDQSTELSEAGSGEESKVVTILKSAGGWLVAFIILAAILGSIRNGLPTLLQGLFAIVEFGIIIGFFSAAKDGVADAQVIAQKRNAQKAEEAKVRSARALKLDQEAKANLAKARLREETYIPDIEARLAKHQEELENIGPTYATIHKENKKAIEEDQKRILEAEKLLPEAIEADKESREISNALLAAERAEAISKLQAANEKAEDLYEQLSLTCKEKSSTVPQEPDWPLIDLLYDTVWRKYASTLQEALLFVRSEARHQELITEMRDQAEKTEQFRRATMAQQATMNLQLKEQINKLNEITSLFSSKISIDQIQHAQTMDAISSGAGAVAARVDNLTNVTASYGRQIAAASAYQAEQLANLDASTRALQNDVRAGNAINAVNAAINLDTNQKVGQMGQDVSAIRNSFGI